MFCKNCGQQLEENAKFCFNCGANLEENNSSSKDKTSGVDNTHSYEQNTTSFTSVNNATRTTIASKKSNKTIIIVALAVVLVVVLAIVAISSLGSKGNTIDKKEVEFEKANKAYENIVLAGDLCIEAMDAIYGAWYFAIYESDDYYSYSMIDEFADKTGLTYNEVVDGLESLGYDSSDYYLLEDFSTAVYVAIAALEKKGVYKQAEKYIEQAKTDLKEVTSEYADYTGYPTLKSYFSEVSSYLEFAKSPTGSFSQLKTTIDNYETNIRTYKNDLKFVFE